jgi:carbamoyl-phosphate synthase small subunit
MQFKPAQLILKTGEVFYGQAPVTQVGNHFGEVVFNTGMVGYIESLTDPSYSGQILVFTYPLIGNYGVTANDTWESTQSHVSGIVMSDLALNYSNHEAIYSLSDWLQQQHIPYLTGVDTRALTKLLRVNGVIPGAITPIDAKPNQFEDFASVDWVKKVSIQQPIEYGQGEKLIIAIDCGMKENIIRSLLEFPVRIKRVPHDYDFTNEAFDAVFVSNGPGDPIQCEKTIHILQKAMLQKKPTFGICLGTQLMALAVGAKTYKLPYGHRAQNQPCLDISTQRCYLTSQNHSYAVDETTLPTGWRVLFRNLNDQSVEGIEHSKDPFFAVQFHPEAAPGPMDAKWLFKKFYDLIK